MAGRFQSARHSAQVEPQSRAATPKPAPPRHRTKPGGLYRLHLATIDVRPHPAFDADGSIREASNGKVSGESMSGQSNNNEMRAVRSRLDFSKIPPPSRSPTSSRFSAAATSASCRWISSPGARGQWLQSSLPPSSHHDFRNVSELEFVDFSIGNWECKCGYLKGLNTCAPPARTADTCHHDPSPGDVLCNFCGTYNKNPDFCTKCGDPSVCSSSTTRPSAKSAA